MIKIIKNIQQQTNLNEQEAWWMLEHITKKSKEKWLTTPNAQLFEDEEKIVNDWIKKLTVDSMPLAYLIGSTPFLDLMIQVQSPILIPRPETEEWVNNLIEKLQPYKNNIKNILDIGTGSGCIALALAKHFSHAQVTATDINPQALKLAQKNAQKNNIFNMTFIQSDLFNKLDQNQCFDIIVSNPPYIDPEAKKTILPQVIQWEDNAALFANQNGLEIIFNILQQAQNYLCKNSLLPAQLVIEHDTKQYKNIKKHAQSLGWTCSVQKDLFNNERTSWFTIQD